MPVPRLFSTAVLVIMATLSLAPTLTVASDLRAYHNSLEARYSRAHSLGDNYQFDPRDGWQTVNASNLAYKYGDDDGGGGLDDDDNDNDNGLDYDDELDDSDEDEHTHLNAFEKRAKSANSKSKPRSAKNKSKAKSKAKAKSPKSNAKAKSPSKAKSKASNKSTSKATGTGFSASLQKVIDTIKGIGKPEPVAITWYTGKDLLNPSCWPKTAWAPTDASFACALTLEGWTTKPACFKFLELCNTVKKCVFVRVVDSCAGCAKGSKHVDLTQAAFKELADLGTGILQVQMRQATDPDGWLENLWGPKK